MLIHALLLAPWGPLVAAALSCTVNRQRFTTILATLLSTLRRSPWWRRLRLRQHKGLSRILQGLLLATGSADSHRLGDVECFGKNVWQPVVFSIPDQIIPIAWSQPGGRRSIRWSWRWRHCKRSANNTTVSGKTNQIVKHRSSLGWQKSIERG